MDARKSGYKEREGKLKDKSEGTVDENREQKFTMKQAAKLRSWKDLGLRDPHTTQEVLENQAFPWGALEPS